MLLRILDYRLHGILGYTLHRLHGNTRLHITILGNTLHRILHDITYIRITRILDYMAVPHRIP